MLVSGIWHGAGWTYLVWGLFFGVLIVAYQALGLGGAWRPSSNLTRLLAWLVMFGLLLVSFILFRAPSLTWLADILRSGLLVGSPEQRAVAVFNLTMTAAYAAPILLKSLMDRRLSADSFLHEVYYVAVTVSMFIYLNAASADFVYFQF
jgi:alginate O-acetyltransferase complex protein AlgI